MALNILSNHAASLAHRNLARAEEASERSLLKLSSGQRVASARDDAISMAIGMRLNSTASSITAGMVNVGQGNSILQIADGGMDVIDDILVRMNTLAVQASSGTPSDTERGLLNDEFVELRGEINRIAAATTFNGIQLLGNASDVSLDYSDLKAGGTAHGLSHANGFANFAISNDNYWAGDDDGDGLDDNRLRIDLIKSGDRIMLNATADIDGTASDRTQTIDITDYMTGGSKALGIGDTHPLEFDEVGVRVDLNFNIGATIAKALTEGSDGAGADGSAGIQVLGSSTAFSVLPDKGKKFSDQVHLRLGTGNGVSIALTAVDGANLGHGKNGTEKSLDDLGANAITTTAKARTAIDTVARAIDDLQRARASLTSQAPTCRRHCKILRMQGPVCWISISPRS
jgi:flagellin